MHRQTSWVYRNFALSSLMIQGFKSIIIGGTDIIGLQYMDRQTSWAYRNFAFSTQMNTFSKSFNPLL